MPKNKVLSRRTVIAGAFVPVSAITAAVKATLSPPERKILEAFVDRLVPHDEYGPSAGEAGVVDYIDRSLSDFLAPEKPALLKGLAALDALRFTAMSPAQQDDVLTSIEKSADLRPFFLRVRQLTMEGMFGDPFYGGNRGYAGWDLIRYPGPRLAVSPEEQKAGVEIKPVRGTHGH